ncbi:MAG: methylenetetrahydrofolate reductase C-terminal domain-containing protein [Candidatus Omnitrophica bacterium]|nr:methylenetetrahydrofolate reductase C-terminal domain-containing protein [Candidatus Omnitrophota bacterium]
MNVTAQKTLQEILSSLEGFVKIFLVGCGKCSTVCKTGGESELLEIKKRLESHGKTVTGMCVPESPCMAVHIKTAFSKQLKQLRESDAVLVLSCGLGVQSVKDNDRIGLVVLPGCSTLFGSTVDTQGNFYEKCSMCGECVLHLTGGICPITLCSKGLLNGPCGGMNKGKCEVDKEKDCAWVLIYKECEKKQKLHNLKQIHKPKNFKKMLHPRRKLIQ